MVESTSMSQSMVSAVLRQVGGNLPVTCMSVEMTLDGLEIACVESMPLGGKVELSLANHRLILDITAVDASSEHQDWTVYRLVPHDNLSEYQEIYGRLIGIHTSATGKRTMTSGRGQINGVIARAKRLNSLGLVGAHVKTWGTRFEYQLATVDLSRTGALLVSDGREALPFREGTLLEIRFSSALLTEKREIACCAKVVRRSVSSHDEAPHRCHIGIQLIDLDDDVQRYWEHLILHVQACVEQSHRGGNAGAAA